LTIAARVDAFGGEYMGEKLRDDVNKKVDSIKERYKVAPSSPSPQRQKKRNFGRKR
jgi:nucleolar protein 56